jgi:hypothetical protein
MGYRLQCGHAAGRLGLALCVGLSLGSISPNARAQAAAESAEQPPPDAEPTPTAPLQSPESAPVPTPAEAAAAPGTEPPAQPPAAAESDDTKLGELTRRVKELEGKQAEAETAALLSAPSTADEIKIDPLKIYGFADVGAQRIWQPKASVPRHVLESGTTTFVIGNLNLYFDAQPIEHWRSLMELRFTNAPQGVIDNYGGLAGTFSRESTQQYDPNGTVVNATMWRGSVVIERAWIEWNQHQSLKLRVGNWFTPFGIWNEDHGTPTLISMGLPQFLVQAWMPIRQTGIMAYGSTFASDWEVAYALTFSNGRQELSNFNFGDTFGYGGRVFARREAGDLNTTFGLSFYTGENSDQVVNLTGLAPLTFQTSKTWEYTEYVAAADAAVDVGATRIRAEGVVRRVVYTKGKRAPANFLAGPGGLEADRWMTGGYLIVAHELPWFGLEPFIFADLSQIPVLVATLPDGLFDASIGLNWHINSAITLKNQVLRAVFFNWLYDSPAKASANNATNFYTRLVIAF